MRFAALLLMIASANIAQSQTVSTQLIANAHKLIIVTAADWNSVSGTMTRYERKGKNWKKLGEPIAIVVGTNGLAFDELFWKSLNWPVKSIPPLKHEGDGRSPAGVFRISHTFGFAPKISNNDFYLPLTPTTECVDDVDSKYYNQIVDRLRIKDVDWNSSEKMRQVEGYRYGAVVAYNDPPVAGRGSCIFLHVWSAPEAGTAGCTAMSDTNAQELLRWLDERTVLVQLPAPILKQLSGSLQLP